MMNAATMIPTTTAATETAIPAIWPEDSPPLVTRPDWVPPVLAGELLVDVDVASFVASLHAYPCRMLATTDDGTYKEPSATESELCHRICMAVPHGRWVAVSGGSAHETLMKSLTGVDHFVPH
jgi:hypothetical protein